MRLLNSDFAVSPLGGMRTGTMPGADSGIEVSAIMPCLNEELTLKPCIEKALSCFASLGVRGEVVVADNGSTDNSVTIAESAGARVVHQPVKGYGAALQAGIMAAKGRYRIMADCDGSYDWGAMEPFIRRLREGWDLVNGTRLRGTILPGAMPPLHRYFGNPVLSGIMNIFFRTGVSDAHCGMRGFSKEAYFKMDIDSTGMEFATEMVVRAANKRLRICEVPITLTRTAGIGGHTLGRSVTVGGTCVSCSCLPPIISTYYRAYSF